MSIDLIDIVKPKNDADFGITVDTDTAGGFRVVADITERDAILTGRRKEGMRVKVQSDGLVYELSGGIGNGDWAEVIASTPVSTTADVTLAVTTGGNDSDPARPSVITSGDYTANPFLTIQAAIDSLPINIKDPDHDATINIGAGSFAGFSLAGFTGAGRIFTQSNSDLAPAVTGPSSGAFTSATEFDATLAAASWTVNDLTGVLCQITGGTGAGQTFVIRSNTSDTLDFSRAQSPALDATSQFSFLSTDTVLNAAGPVPTVVVNIGSCQCRVETSFLRMDVPAFETGLQIQDCLNVLCTNTSDIGGSSLFSAVALRCSDLELDGIGSLGGANSSIFIDGCTSLIGDDWGMDEGGIDIFRCTHVQSNGMATVGAIAAGMTIRECNSVRINRPYIDGGRFQLRDTSTATFNAVAGSKFQVSNSTSEGIQIRNALLKSNGIGGTGNGSYGVRFRETNGFLQTSTIPTITGTTGDFTVDNGATVKTWATELPALGSFTVDAARLNQASRVI